MRFQKILKNFAIVVLIISIILLAVDIFKMLKINFNFMDMQSSNRISTTSTVDSVRYEPTNYVIANKEDALTEIKQITLGLKNDYINSNNKAKLFEIGNIHKIENLFYTYKSYAIVKYKLLNIIEDMPKLYNATKGYSNEQLTNYFNNNSAYIDKVYGITTATDFIELSKSLKFLDNSKIKYATVEVVTIDFDYDNDCLTFDMELEGNSIGWYSVRTDFYKSNDNQVKPYVSFIVNN